uniref:Myb/SANT-like domain-containing protein n=1 Tax=Setaria viridis TaxID=4556 RepID=A0A4U6VM39_SETVI|nr:hypothetical protein SEVIR_3G347700v2 [Setaria viridis]
MEKGKKSGSGRGYISWNDDMDKALLDTFVEYYNKEKCNVDISKDNIMARNKTFDKHYTMINGMLESSGFGWDWNKNKISVDSDSVWEEYVAVKAIGYRHKTVLYWNSISLVFCKDHATGEAAKIAAESSKDMSKEDLSNKEPTSSATSGSLRRQRSGDSFTSMMAEKMDKFVEALKEKAPKGPTSKQILNTLNEVQGLDEDTLLDLFDILTGDARKYESLLALPEKMRKRWLLKQLNK